MPPNPAGVPIPDDPRPHLPPALVRLLENGAVLTHPWVIGEIVGHHSHRREAIGLLRGLPQATTATSDEVLQVVDQQRLHGRGIGYVDAQLLASTRLTGEARLWTNDRRLARAAGGLDCGVDPT